MPSTNRFLTQPLSGILAGGGCVAVMFWMWSDPALRPAASSLPFSLVLPAFLVLLALAGYRYPVHVEHAVKTNLVGIPLVLMAVLLSPALAAVCAAAGLLAGELSIKKVRGMYWSDIATQVGRETVLVAVAALVAHATLFGNQMDALPVAGAALVVLAGDILTSPLLLTPLSGQPASQVIRSMVQNVGKAEAAQYILATIGALAATRAPWSLVLLFLPVLLVHRAFQSTREVQDETRNILVSMADAVDMRDPYTGGHSARVTELSGQMLRAMGMRGLEVDLILQAARVHDIGKIGIPDSILLKSGHLSDEEKTIMNSHPERGAKLLSRYPDFARGAEIILHHHEAWDGSGYPHRRRGTEIPFGARIIAVADSFDAMTTDRPYRKGMLVQQALTILQGGSGKQWDPAAVDALLDSLAAERAVAPRPAAQALPQPAG